jgi:membrane dipeptidase
MSMALTTADDFAHYDFGLAQPEEDRAARLHAESIVVDGLYQGPYGHRAFTDAMVASLQADPANADLLTALRSCRDLVHETIVSGEFPYRELWEASGLTCASWGIQVGSAAGLAGSVAHLTRMLDQLPWLHKALTAANVRRAKSEGHRAIFVNCQPTEPISRDLGLLDAAIDVGLRMLMLTYNSQDHVGAGCTERTNAGVTNFGMRVIAKLNESGVIVDTAHCGRQTTLDACSISEAPVVASHSSAEAVYLHARAKSDVEIEAIASTGGLVGVFAVPFFVGPGDKVGFDAVLDHIDHISSLVGPQHVGIGTDWPMGLPSFVLEQMTETTQAIGFRPEDNIDGERTIIGFDDYRDFPNFARGLVKRGYGDDEIRGILGGNWLRVIEQVCG